MTIWAMPAHANCSALPILAPLVEEIEHLINQTAAGAIIESAKKIATDRRQINKTDQYQTLSALGFERHLKSVMEFKIKLGALSQIALSGDSAKIAVYYKSSDFQRRYIVVNELMSNLCASRGSTSESDAATRRLTAISGYRLTELSGLKGQTAAYGLLSLCIAALAGMGILTELHRRRTRRSKRRSKRIPCDIPVLVGALGKTSKQKLVDISRTGANMQTDLELPLGTELALRFGTKHKTGKVKWSNEHFAGLVFDHVLTKDELNSLLSNTCSINTSQNKKTQRRQGVAQIS